MEPTPEMIEIGRAILAGFDRDEGGTSAMAAEIYRRMDAARPAPATMQMGTDGILWVLNQETGVWDAA